MERLNKYMSGAGVCSRREADRLIAEGRVSVDGVRAVTGMQVEEGQQVALDGKPIQKERNKLILIAVNKPQGVVCSEKSQGGDINIIDFLNYPKRVTYAGRLDKDSEGLLLMTNQGNLIHRLTCAANFHEKEYEVAVSRPYDDGFLKAMAEGVFLKELETTTRPCRVERIGSRKFRIVLTQGLNRQIRRMCEELGHRVVELKRIRIMNIRLGHLQTGAWRNVTRTELEELMRLLGEQEPEGLQNE